jgi:hypothetical protein
MFFQTERKSPIQSLELRRLGVIACAGLLFANAGLANDKKLTQEDRVEILRGLMAEYATVKSYLPRSKKPLAFHSNGTWDKQKWEEQGRELGPAARVGDLVQITRVTIEDDKVLLEINNGLKKGGHWYDHVEVGMGNRTSPINGNQNSSAPGGTYLALLFDKQMPALKAADLKKMLTPVLDFEKHSATENYVEKLPEPVQKAIKANKAIEGMDREQVLLALGKPRHKERDVKDGSEMEDWVYGQPPGKITFVTFNGSKVVKVKEAYADVGGSTAAPLPPR